MNPELEIEILELMEAKGISYDEAADRYYRRIQQMELAFDRQHASKTKGDSVKNKQKKFSQALAANQNQ